MRKYLVKRLLLSVVILFFVTFIIYLLMRCMPSSYVENMARQLSQAPGSKPYEEWLAQLNAQYGLDLGLIPGFFVQLKNLCTGNFGDSWKYTVPVIQKFNEVIWVSFIMGAISLVFELLIAVPLGIVAATKQYSVTDYTVTTVALLGMSLPTFFFATLLKLIFCIKLRWFDLVGLTGRDFNSLSQFGQILDMAKHLVLPIVTLVFISIGPWMRYVRTNMLEVLNADYIRTARAKGLSEHKVIYRRLAARPFCRRAHHRDAVRHPRHRLHLVQCDGRGRYPLLHVLHDVPGDPDPAGQPDLRHPVRGGRPPRAHRVRKEDVTNELF